MTDEIDANTIYQDIECTNVHDLHVKFGFPVNYIPVVIDSELMSQRASFIQEELNEFMEAATIGDLAGMADALIDICYVAKGTAVQLGLPWGALWDDVHLCNMNKEIGVNPNRPDQKFDLIKPPGWTGPVTNEILEEFGYGSPTDNS